MPSLVEVGPVVLEKNFFLKFSIYFYYFTIISPFHLKKFESLLPKDALCQVWLKLTPWFWRRRFLKVVNLSLLFPNYLPFWIGLALHLKKPESPLPRDSFYQIWLKLVQWFWRRILKCEKVTDGRTHRQTDGHTRDEWWSKNLTWAFSSGELKMNAFYKVYVMRKYNRDRPETWKKIWHHYLELWKCFLFQHLYNVKFPFSAKD